MAVINFSYNKRTGVHGPEVWVNKFCNFFFEKYSLRKLLNKLCSGENNYSLITKPIVPVDRQPNDYKWLVQNFSNIIAFGVGSIKMPLGNLVQINFSKYFSVWYHLIWTVFTEFKKNHVYNLQNVFSAPFLIKIPIFFKMP